MTPLRWAFAMALLAPLAAAAAPNNSCGLSDRGIETIPVGTVRDLMGEVRIVALVDLSMADVSLLNMSVPKLCLAEGRDRQIDVLCRAMSMDIHRYQTYITETYNYALPTPDTALEPRREKRQILAGLAVATTGLAGYFLSKVTGSSDKNKLVHAINKLESQTDDVDTTLIHLDGQIVALSKINVANEDAVHTVAAELRTLRDQLEGLSAKVARVDLMTAQLAELATFRTTLEGIKDALDHHQFLASQRYEGLITAQGHRLSSAVIPPHVFYGKLKEIKERLDKHHKTHVDFGSLESAYVATRVEYIDFVNVKVGMIYKVVARMVWKTPYVLEQGASAQLYHLRAYPYQANLSNSETLLVAQLRSPYIAVRTDPRNAAGEYYQTVDAEDLLDVGNATFINMKPSSFDHSTTQPSCEYSTVKGRRHRDDFCLHQSKPTKHMRSFYTLASGCWMIHGSGLEMLEKCETIGLGTQPFRLGPAKVNLFHPMCGCKYNSGTREFPMSGSGCSKESRILVQLPSVGKEDFFNLFIAHNVSGTLPAKRAKRAAEGTKGSQRLEALWARMPAELSGDGTTVRQATERLKLQEYPRASRYRDHVRHTEKESLDMHQWLLYAAVVVCGLVVAIVTHKSLAFARRRCTPQTKPIKLQGDVPDLRIGIWK